MSNSLTGDVLSVLQPGQGPDLFLTVGNPFRSDDGVGSYLASCLKKLPVRLLDAGQTPENIIEDTIALKPARVIILDAADFGGKPGEVRVIPEEAIPETTLTTHMVPMNVVSRLITESTSAKIVFIGIQPKTVALGEGLSSEVRQAANEIVTVVRENFKP
jgi:hydrogenase maturation protease HycI